MLYLLYTLIGAYLLFIEPAVAIVVLIMSVYHLFRWVEHRGERYPRKAYLILLIVLVINALFSFSMQGFIYTALGFLTILNAVTVWLSYQQLKIDERNDGE